MGEQTTAQCLWGLSPYAFQYQYKYTWLFDYIGAGAHATAGAITAPAFGQDYNYYWGRNNFRLRTGTVQAFALSWTTGTATVTARGGYNYRFGVSSGLGRSDDLHPVEATIQNGECIYVDIAKC